MYSFGFCLSTSSYCRLLSPSVANLFLPVFRYSYLRKRTEQLNDYEIAIAGGSSSPLWISLLLLVREHFVARHVGRVAGDVEAVGFYPIRHVVVLATPAPEHVTEAVHQAKLLARHR